MKRIVLALLTLLLAAGPVAATAAAADLVNIAGASRIALSGYDPVAFFTDAKPVTGSPGISATFKGATYLFASEGHKALFTKDPKKYAPQYGGFCAYGASTGHLAPVDISTWQIRDGKLYLNFSPDVFKKFNEDFSGNVAKAETNWPDLVKKYAGRPAS